MERKKVVGYYTCLYPLKLVGKYVVFSTGSELKAKYSKKYENIIVPLIHRRVFDDDGINFHYRIVLDVRKKSKRQINLLKLGSLL